MDKKHETTTNNTADTQRTSVKSSESGTCLENASMDSLTGISDEGESLIDISDTENESYYAGGSVCLSCSDSEEYEYKISTLASIPGSGQDDVSKQMEAIFNSIGLSISGSKEALRDINDSIVENRMAGGVVKLKLEDEPSLANQMDIQDHITPASTNEVVPQGDQIKSTESSSTLGDLIDFKSGNTISNSQQGLQHPTLPNSDADTQSEVNKSLTETTKEVDRIGGIIKNISEVLKAGPDGASNTIGKEVEEMVLVINDLYQKIPGHVALLDNLSKEHKERCTKIWETISKDLDTMNMLAESIKKNVLGS